MYFITARKLSLGQGNIFTSMCHSFCPQEGVCGVHGEGGGVHGEDGACMAKGGGGHAWQRGMRGRGAWVAIRCAWHGWQLGVHGKGGMHGRGACVAEGHAWQGACVPGGMVAREV